jgi:hypothetical protein
MWGDVDCIDLAHYRGSCDCGNELSGFIKCEKFVDLMSTCWFFSKDSDPCVQLCCVLHAWRTSHTIQSMFSCFFGPVSDVQLFLRPPLTMSSFFGPISDVQLFLLPPLAMFSCFFGPISDFQLFLRPHYRCTAVYSAPLAMFSYFFGPISDVQLFLLTHQRCSAVFSSPLAMFSCFFGPISDVHLFLRPHQRCSAVSSAPISTIYTDFVWALDVMSLKHLRCELWNILRFARLVFQ